VSSTVVPPASRRASRCADWWSPTLASGAAEGSSPTGPTGKALRNLASHRPKAPHPQPEHTDPKTEPPTIGNMGDPFRSLRRPICAGMGGSGDGLAECSESEQVGLTCVEGVFTIFTKTVLRGRTQSAFRQPACPPGELSPMASWLPHSSLPYPCGTACRDGRSRPAPHVAS